MLVQVLLQNTNLGTISCHFNHRIIIIIPQKSPQKLEALLFVSVTFIVSHQLW